MRLIDADGTQLGIVPLEEALDKARRKTLDLVEVSAESDPPVCRIQDYARYIFEAKRRLKESRKKAKTVEMKEIKLRPKIDPHDYSIKLSQIREFIEKGHKVKVTMRYRQYEMRQFEVGTRVLDRLTVDIADVAEPDSANRVMDGARMQTMILQSKKKGGAPAGAPKPPGGGAPPSRSGGGAPPRPGGGSPPPGKPGP